MNSLRTLIVPRTLVGKTFLNGFKCQSNVLCSFQLLNKNRFYSTNTQAKKKYDIIDRSTFKPIDSRKTFLMDSYKDLMDKNEVVLFVHYNNLLKQEDDFFRSQIKSCGGVLTMLRNGIFRAYLMASHLEDPAAPIKQADKNKNHPLLPLFKGPTAAIVFKQTDTLAVSKVLKALQRHQDKLFVVGAKVENDVFDIKKLNEFKDLPSKPQLQSQLLGLLHVLSGLGLVRTLEKGSQSLYLTLQSHKNNNLDTDKSKDSKAEPEEK